MPGPIIAGARSHLTRCARFRHLPAARIRSTVALLGMYTRIGTHAGCQLLCNALHRFADRRWLMSHDAARSAGQPLAPAAAHRCTLRRGRRLVRTGALPVIRRAERPCATRLQNPLPCRPAPASSGKRPGCRPLRPALRSPPCTGRSSLLLLLLEREQPGRRGRNRQDAGAAEQPEDPVGRLRAHRQPVPARAQRRVLIMQLVHPVLEPRWWLGHPCRHGGGGGTTAAAAGGSAPPT